MRKITNQELNRPSVEEFAAMPRIPVVVVLDNVRSAQNVGAFFRTGDAFAIERIYLCGITATPPARDIHKTALGAELTVPWHYTETTLEAIEQLKQEGYTLLAIEQVEGAVMLDELVVVYIFCPLMVYTSIFCPGSVSCARPVPFTPVWLEAKDQTLQTFSHEKLFLCYTHLS